MAGIPFLHNIDLNDNQLLNAKLHTSGTAPSNPGTGTIWYDSDNSLVKIYNSGWTSIAGDITAVTSATTGQLTVASGTGPAPALTIVTAAIANGGSALATADQIHTFVTGQTDTMAAATTGNAATATKIASITNSNIVQLTAAQTLDSKTLNTPTLNSPVISGSFSGGAFLDEDNFSSNSSSKAASQQSIKAYVDAQNTATQSMGDGFVIEDDDGTEVTLTEGKEMKIIGAGGLTTNWTDTSNGSDGDPYDLTLTIGTLNQSTSGTAAVATTITITDNESTNEENAVLFSANADTDGGNLGVEQDHSGITYNPSSGNLTATLLTGTLQTAAQGNITSVGTLNGGAISSGFGNIDNGSSTLNTGAATVASLIVSGNLTVNGTTTDVDTTNLIIEDPLIKLAKLNSTSDSLDIGFYGLCDPSTSQDTYTGLFRDASDSGIYKLFHLLQVEPTTTVDITATGFALGHLEVGTLETTTLTIPDNAVAVGKIAGGTLPTDVKINNDNWSGTDLSVANGGTGLSALTSGYALLGNGTGTLQMINSTADSTMLVGNGSTMVAETGATLRTSIGVDAAGTDNSTGVTLAGTPDYITISGQVITRGLIVLTTDVSGVLPEANLPNASATAEGVVELATTTEASDGTDTSRAVTAEGLQTFHNNRNKSWVLNNTTSGVVSSDNITYTITHGMGASRLYKVELIGSSGSYQTVHADVARPTDTTITVVFASAVSAGAYTALVAKI
jgi:hypothetical protein